jgi:hypothetical protein
MYITKADEELVRREQCRLQTLEKRLRSEVEWLRAPAARQIPRLAVADRLEAILEDRST